MKLNQKFYPKAIVLRKWMVVGAAIVMGAMILSFMYNLSHQNKKKQEDKKVLTQNSNGERTLASREDMQWIYDSNIDKNANLKGVEKEIPTDANNVEMSSFGRENSSNSALPKIKSQNSYSSDLDQNTQDMAQKSLEEKQKAMMMPITANQLTGATGESSMGGTSALANKVNTTSGNTDLSTNDPNGQAQKEAFINKAKGDEEDVYLDKSMIKPRSPYELQAGSIIPGILISGVNSDLPGQLVGQIRQNVFDSITGDHILIPQGSKVVGLYDSKVTYGQERVLVVWKRIIYPNGQSIDLSGMPGVDLSGYAGFKDQVNNHFGKIFGSVLLLSTMSAGAQLSQPNNSNSDNNDYPTVGQTMAQSLGTNISDFGTQLAEKNLNIQPTLVIRPGYLFNISVTKDIVFPGPYGES
ncbi:MAG: hypothetical protein K2Q33_07565 [Gammaproteobacteria bacterium]|nr:hypothetical protein [Gammaproteobacteria bacterium]